MSIPSVDFPKLKLKRTDQPIPLQVSFGATDASGIGDTTLEHRINTKAFVDVPLGTARGTSATLRVSKKNAKIHRFRSRATDAAVPPNTSLFQVSPAFRVKVHEEGSWKIKQKGVWARKWSSSFSGGSVKATSRKGAKLKLTATGTDFAIVSWKGPDRGKAQVFVDGQYAATIDLFSRATQPRRIVWKRSFATASTHTIALKVTGTKNSRSRGRRVDLDAFIVLTQP